MKRNESILFSVGIFYASKEDYTNGFLAAANISNDAGTNGAIVAALRGTFSGSDVINKKWIDQMQEINKINFYKIADDLLSAKNSIKCTEYEQ